MSLLIVLGTAQLVCQSEAGLSGVCWNVYFPRSRHHMWMCTFTMSNKETSVYKFILQKPKRKLQTCYSSMLFLWMTLWGTFKKLTVNYLTPWIFTTLRETIQARRFQWEVLPIFFFPFILKKKKMASDTNQEALPSPAEQSIHLRDGFLLVWIWFPPLRLVTWDQVANGFLFVLAAINKMIIFNLKHLVLFRLSFIEQMHIEWLYARYCVWHILKLNKF